MQLRWIQEHNPVLPTDERALQVLNRLAQGTAANLLDPEAHSMIQSFRLIAKGDGWSHMRTAYTSDSVGDIALRCRYTFDIRGVVNLVAMLNLVQLVIKTDR